MKGHSRFLVTILLVFQAFQVQAGGSIKGEVYANRGDLHAVTLDSRATFFPGHILRITVNGENKVDINAEGKSKRSCDFLGIICKRVYWTEHHTKSPDEIPAYIVLRPVSGIGPKVEVQVATEEVTVQIPPARVAEEQPYEMVGKIGGPGHTVDPGRSSGSFSIEVTVDASGRLSAIDQYLAEKPGAFAVIRMAEKDVHMLEGQPRQIAQRLRTYARQNYPLGGDNQKNQLVKTEHLSLLNKAKELAPEDTENNSSLAAYYDAIGLPEQAEQERNETIRILEKKVASHPSPENKLQLANEFSNKAKSVLARLGGIDSESISIADMYLRKATELLRTLEHKDALFAALISRANNLRTLRTRAALQTAAALFREARSMAPITISGDIALPGSGQDDFWAGPAYAVIVTAPAVGSENPHWIKATQKNADLILQGYDFNRQKLLASENQSLYWIDPVAPDISRQYAGALDGRVIDVANGTILVLEFGTLKTFLLTSRGGLLSVELNGKDFCEIQPALQKKPFPNRPSSTREPFRTSLSWDGSAVAVACGHEVAVFDLLDARMSKRSSYSYDPSDTFSIKGVSLSHNGKRMALSLERPVDLWKTNQRVDLFNTAGQGSAKKLAVFNIEGGPMVGGESVSFSPQTNQFAFPLKVNEIGIFEADNGTRINHLVLKKLPALNSGRASKIGLKWFTPDKLKLSIYVGKYPILQLVTLPTMETQDIPSGSGLSRRIHYFISTKEWDLLCANRLVANLNHYEFAGGELKKVNTNPVPVLLGPEGELPQLIPGNRSLLSQGFTSLTNILVSLEDGQVTTVPLEGKQVSSYWQAASYMGKSPGEWYRFVQGRWGETTELQVFKNDLLVKSLPLPFSHFEIDLGRVKLIRDFLRTGTPFSSGNPNANFTLGIDTEEEFNDVLQSQERLMAMWVPFPRFYTPLLFPALFYNRADGGGLVPVHDIIPQNSFLRGGRAVTIDDKDLARSDQVFRYLNIGFRPYHGFDRDLNSGRSTLPFIFGFDLSQDRFGFLKDDGSFVPFSVPPSVSKNFSRWRPSIVVAENQQRILLGEDGLALFDLDGAGNPRFLQCSVCKDYNKDVIEDLYRERGGEVAEKLPVGIAIQLLGLPLTPFTSDKTLQFIAFPTKDSIVVLDVDNMKRKLTTNITQPVLVNRKVLITRDDFHFLKIRKIDDQGN